MIEQIRHLQNKEPFESFALELSNGRVIQIYDRHQVATASGPGEYVIGILYGSGSFEVIKCLPDCQCQRWGSSQGQRRIVPNNGGGPKKVWS
jgi:hypothetical protein